tara:strand:+ start:538 stop:810 length:273 start_codon:yes stop_codon:yes gene_type:complete
MLKIRAHPSTLIVKQNLNYVDLLRLLSIRVLFRRHADTLKKSLIESKSLSPFFSKAEKQVLLKIKRASEKAIKKSPSISERAFCVCRIST